MEEEEPKFADSTKTENVFRKTKKPRLRFLASDPPENTVFIPIGSGCVGARLLKLIRKRKTALPFDHIYADVQTISYFLKKCFDCSGTETSTADALAIDFLDVIDHGKILDHNDHYLQHRRFPDLKFRHELKDGETIPEMQAKYTRRFENLRKALVNADLDIVFVYVSLPSSDYFDELLCPKESSRKERSEGVCAQLEELRAMVEETRGNLSKNELQQKHCFSGSTTRLLIFERQPLGDREVGIMLASSRLEERSVEYVVLGEFGGSWDNGLEPMKVWFHQRYSQVGSTQDEQKSIQQDGEKSKF